MRLLPLLLLVIILLVLPMTFAVKPVAQIAEGDNVLEIRTPQAETIKQNENVQLNVHVFNKSTGLAMNNISIACVLDIYNRTGFHIDILEFDFDGADFELGIGGGNFTTLGRHAFIIVCNSTNIGGFVGSSIDVTITGEPIKDDIPIGTALIILGAGAFFLTLSYVTSASKHLYLRLFFLIITFTIILIGLNFAYVSSIDINSSTNIQNLLITLYRVGLYSFIIFMIYVVIYYLLFPVFMHFKQYEK